MRPPRRAWSWIWFIPAALAGQGNDLVDWTLTADTATSRAGVAFPEGTAAFESFTGEPARVLTFDLPRGVGLNAVDVGPAGNFLFVPDTWVSLPLGAGTASPRDVVSFDGTTSAIVFDGELQGIPDGVEISALASSPLGSWLALAFDSRVRLPDGTDIGPQHAVLWSTTTHQYEDEGGIGLKDPGSLRLSALAWTQLFTIFYAVDGDATVFGTPVDANDLFRYENGTAIIAADAGADAGWGDAKLGDVAVRTRGIFDDGFESGTTLVWTLF